jgi:beta-galactosidase
VLHVEDATVLATYAPTEIGATAAVTTRPAGRGCVTYVSTLPNPALARSLGRWLVPQPAEERWAAGPTVTVSTGTTPAGTVTFVSNWSSETASVRFPEPVRDLVTGARHATGSVLSLEARAAAVFASSGDSTE